ncbi:phosphohistidine phosphatase SixA [Larsenimonas salina]|uniref:phosphohistidine phosphatase SixA n=1 Tax=Larsenimonas salina TaxID=1295565 RepID=UPI002072D718|nr:phosphohistidine phosphatase SixA [Larsenimonas salina]MCM5703560.1 phosphohistidine phosphatase SixA [Larsenimonas salina]
MKLFIMRHGEAASGTPDASRPLEPLGEQEVRQSAQWLKETLTDSERESLTIVGSPYKRARQTADLVAQALGAASSLSLPLITPDAPPESVIEWLHENASDGSPWLLVSHMPLVADLVGRLVDGGTHARMPMGTADIAVLDADVWAAGCATLITHQTPGQAVAR